MRKENLKMRQFLLENGVDATPKYIAKGSLKGTWRLYSKALKTEHNAGLANWWDRPGLWARLSELGFTDFDGKQLSQYCGNGGLFQVFVRFNRTKEFLTP